MNGAVKRRVQNPAANAAQAQSGRVRALANGEPIAGWSGPVLALGSAGRIAAASVQANALASDLPASGAGQNGNAASRATAVANAVANDVAIALMPRARPRAKPRPSLAIHPAT